MVVEAEAEEGGIVEVPATAGEVTGLTAVLTVEEMIHTTHAQTIMVRVMATRTETTEEMAEIEAMEVEVVTTISSPTKQDPPISLMRHRHSNNNTEVMVVMEEGCRQEGDRLKIMEDMDQDAEALLPIEVDHPVTAVTEAVGKVVMVVAATVVMTMDNPTLEMPSRIKPIVGEVCPITMEDVEEVAVGSI